MGDIPQLVALRDETSEANNKLVQMEHAGLDARDPDTLRSARETLDGPAYTKQKQVYADSMNGLIAAMGARVTEQVRDEQAKVIANLPVSTALAALVAAIGIIALRRLVRWQQHFEERVADATALAAARQSDNAMLLRELLRAEKQERERLGQLVHDDLQQLVVAARTQASVAQELLERGDVPESREAVALCVARLRDALVSLRNLHRDLDQPPLHEMTLAEAVEQIAERSPLRVELAIEVLPEEPVELAVVQLVHKATQELLLNTAKYAGVAAARVELSVSATGALTLDVQDEGCGFDRANTPAGTGLNDLQRRVATIGGRLEMASTPDRGTRVTLHIPDVRSKHRTSTGPRAQRAVQGDAPLRVLIVDDHRAMGQNTLRLLSQDGRFEIVGVVSTPTDGIAVAATLVPDVVVLDYQMPGMRGDAVARQILAAHPTTRIVAYSALPEQAKGPMLEAGAAAVVDKDSDHRDLIAAVLGDSRDG